MKNWRWYTKKSWKCRAVQIFRNTTVFRCPSGCLKYLPGGREVGNSPPRWGMVNRCEGWYPDWGQWTVCPRRRTLWPYSVVISWGFWWWGSFPCLFRGAFGDEGVCSFGFWEETLFSLLGRWGREGDTTHGVRIVFHSMSCLQTSLISILYKQSLQWWFHCLWLQACVGSVCVGGTVLTCRGRDVYGWVRQLDVSSGSSTRHW